MGTAQSSPNKDERPAGAFYSCRCLRAGCSALRGSGLRRPCWLPIWRPCRLPLRRGQARGERGRGARARHPVRRHRHRLQELLRPRRPLPAGGRGPQEEAPAPAVASVLPYGLGYAGLGYHGLGYAGLGYAGLGYAGLHGYPYAVAAPAPVEVEVPVTQYKYVPEVKTVELPPACQNAFGFAVPCA